MSEPLKEQNDMPKQEEQEASLAQLTTSLTKRLKLQSSERKSFSSAAIPKKQSLSSVMMKMPGTKKLSVSSRGKIRATPTSRILQSWLEDLGAEDQSREMLIEVLNTLHLSGKASESVEKVLYILREKKKKSVAQAIAEVGCDISTIYKAYTEGVSLKGHTEAIMEAHSALPDVMRWYKKIALSGNGACATCHGSGTVRRVTVGQLESQNCPSCLGTRFDEEHKGKLEAMRTLLEVTKLKEVPGSPTFNNQVIGQIQVTSEGAFEKHMQALDRVLYPTHKKEEVVDAEVMEEV